MDHRRPGFPGPRRVVTTPTTFQPTARESSSQSGGLVETLYIHPNIKIIAFTATPVGASPRSPGRATVATTQEEPGSLSWSSQLERTIAVGAFRIYRAPGSVAFLSCGSALQPILPKSQAWCMDEESSKFVLQIRRPQYWRIEVPVAELDDQQRAFALRGVLDQILQFEKTECPFSRTFTVELPERPQTPIKKRPWTPIRRSFVTLSNSPEEISPSPKPPAATRRSSLAHHSSSEKTEKPESTSTESAVRGSTEEIREDARGSGVEHRDALPAVEAAKEEIQEDHTQNLHLDVDSPTPSTPLPRVEEKQSSVLSIVKTLDEEYLAAVEQAEERVAEKKKQIETPGMSNPATLSRDIQRPRTPVTAPISSPISKQWDNIMEKQPTAATEVANGQERSPGPLPAYLEARDDSEVLSAVVAAPLMSLTRFAAVPVLVNEEEVEQQQEGMVEKDEERQQHQDDLSSAITAEAVELDGTSGSYDVHEGSGVVGARRRKLRNFRGSRSITAPPQLTLVTSPPSKRTSKLIESPPSQDNDEESKEPVSPTGSSDSFHSVQSWHSPITPLPPSPPASQPNSPTSTFPYPHNNILIPSRAAHHREPSDLTVTPDTKGTWDVASQATNLSSEGSAATAPDACFEAAEQLGNSGLSDDEVISTAVATRRPYARHRATTSSISVGRRALSPLPPAANLFSPPGPKARQRQSRGPMEAVRRIPMAIISKTCEVLLGPPSHLINLMLKVAAKIAAGEWRGIVLGFGEGGEKIPVQWDYSDGEFSSWGDDDDYYMSHVAESVRSSNASVANWEESNIVQTGGSDDIGFSWGVD